MVKVGINAHSSTYQCGLQQVTYPLQICFLICKMGITISTLQSCYIRNNLSKIALQLTRRTAIIAIITIKVDSMGGYYTPSAVLIPTLLCIRIIYYSCWKLWIPRFHPPWGTGKMWEKTEFFNIILDSDVFSCCCKKLQHSTIRKKSHKSNGTM